MPFSKMPTTDKKSARASAEAQALAEVRRAAEKQREKSEKLKQLRLERDAALPPKKKPAARRKAAAIPNLAKAQRNAKR